MNRQRNNKKDGNKIRQRKAERRRRIKKENYESSVIFLIVKKLGFLTTWSNTLFLQSTDVKTHWGARSIF